jgi:CRP/FNR family transcriptional regulator, cyclic AMP receptor protein
MRKALVFFGILDDSDVEWLVTTGVRRQTPAGELLIREGIEIDAMFLVIDGTFRVTVGSKQVALLKPGEILGEMSFVDSHPPSASVQALEQSLVLSIGRQALFVKLASDTPFAARFYRALAVFLAERLRRSVSQLGYGESGPTSEQIADRDELDTNVLENLGLASARFDQMQRRLRVLPREM